MLNGRKRKIFSFVMLTAFLGLLLSGCSAVDTLTSLKAKFAGEDEHLADYFDETEFLETEADADMPGETREIVLYFSDPEGKALVAEERTIPKVEGIARETIKELISGPHPESGLLGTIPAGTALRDINIRPDGLAIVDFTKELVTNFQGDSTSEILTVYSIVNTLTQFDTVDAVQILVDGQVVETLNGHVDVSEAMARDDAIIK